MSAAIILGVAMVTVVYVAAIMVCFLYIRRCVFSYAFIRLGFRNCISLVTSGLISLHCRLIHH